MKHENNLTSKGQVTVPKDIRDALGLLPGRPVRFEIDEDGNARILKADDAVEVERRRADFRERLKKAQAIFKANDTMPGVSTDDYMAMIREPIQSFELHPNFKLNPDT
jgi:AbrB family looped-hinge helix DNA binding protein